MRGQGPAVAHQEALIHAPVAHVQADEDAPWGGAPG